MSNSTPNQLWKNLIPVCGVEYPLLSHLGFRLSRKFSHSHREEKLLSDSLVAAGLFSVLHLSCLQSCKSGFIGPMNIGRGSLVDQFTVPGLWHWEHPLVQKYDRAVWISSLLVFSLKINSCLDIFALKWDILVQSISLRQENMVVKGCVNCGWCFWLWVGNFSFNWLN